MERLQLRPYQEECLEKAKAKNTIVVLPTGYGKTLIAARLIEYCLEQQPDKKVAFLVPTRPLVEQQAEYCKSNCSVYDSTTGSSSPVLVQRIVGQEQAAWTQTEWDDCMHHCHIVLGTAALFQQAFVTDKYLNIRNFSLLVFDECHNAVGNSPMASLMRDGVAPLATTTRGGVAIETPCRILGLTASFVSGSLKNMEKKRRKLEALMMSTIVCPHVESRFTDDSFIHVHWELNHNIDSHREAITVHVEAAVKNVGHIKDVTKIVNRCKHVFDELGLDALKFYIEKVIVQQVIEKAAVIKELGGSCIQLAERMISGLPSLRNELTVLENKLCADPTVQQAASRSLKLEKLIDILRLDFARKGHGYRGIVFVEQVALVSALADQINKALPDVRCGAVTGTGHQNENERQEHLEKLKCGDLQILAATATLEEGIDVYDCEFVVRYTTISTTKAHIQGSGRARHQDAVVYYFENNPDIERQKEASMTATAKDHSLSLNPNEFRAAASTSVSVDSRHPYPYTVPGVVNSDNGNRNNAGEVNVFNCKPIFNQYCSTTLQASIQPDKVLYQYSDHRGQQKVLRQIQYPTPMGWASLSAEQYMKFWDGAALGNIFLTERTKNKTAADKEEMMFVYLVVVQLREKGFLDCHNKPDPSIRALTKRNCPLPSDGLEEIRFSNLVIQSYNNQPETQDSNDINNSPGDGNRHPPPIPTINIMAPAPGGDQNSYPGLSDLTSEPGYQV